MCGGIEFGKCEICGKEAPLERTYFYYNIPCDCCGCKVDDKDMHFELVHHCEKCAPDIPLQIRPFIKGKIDSRPYRQTIKRMAPYDIRGQFCIKKFKIEKQDRIMAKASCKVLQCPHLVSDGLSQWCMNGRFPCDCESCNCSDKHWVEVYTSTSTNN